MDRSRLRKEVSLTDRLLKFGLRRRNMNKSCLFRHQCDFGSCQARHFAPAAFDEVPPGLGMKLDLKHEKSMNP